MQVWIKKQEWFDFPAFSKLSRYEVHPDGLIRLKSSKTIVKSKTFKGTQHVFLLTDDSCFSPFRKDILVITAKLNRKDKVPGSDAPISLVPVDIQQGLRESKVAVSECIGAWRDIENTPARIVYDKRTLINI